MENAFTTYDILLSSFLLTHKEIALLEIKETDFRKFLFVFSNPDRCKQLYKDYLNNAPASARELFSNREMLISEIKFRSGGKYGKHE